MRPCGRLCFAIAAWLAVAVLLTGMTTASDTPPTIRPFGPRKVTRSDAILGYAELSDGTVYPGRLYLTRDARLKIFDATAQRQREIPLRVVRKIECKAEREWFEKEWRFKENASDEKVYTGRSYPARECVHTVTLQDGRKIVGPLSTIVYVAQKEGAKPTRLLLHKRQKGPVGTQLKSLVYVRTIALGEEAFAEGQRRSRRTSSGRRKKRTTTQPHSAQFDALGAGLLTSSEHQPKVSPKPIDCPRFLETYGQTVYGVGRPAHSAVARSAQVS